MMAFSLEFPYLKLLNSASQSVARITFLLVFGVPLPLVEKLRKFVMGFATHIRYSERT